VRWGKGFPVIERERKSAQSEVVVHVCRGRRGHVAVPHMAVPTAKTTAVDGSGREEPSQSRPSDLRASPQRPLAVVKELDQF